jgi:ATP-dependent RNA helicase DOB1
MLDPSESPQSQIIVDVLLNCAPGNNTLSGTQNHSINVATPSGIMPCPPTCKGVPLVIPILLSAVDAISHLRVFLPKDLRSLPARETAWKSVLECQKRFPGGIALLDPILHMGIKDEKFKTLVGVG